VLLLLVGVELLLGTRSEKTRFIAKIGSIFTHRILEGEPAGLNGLG